MVTFLLVLQLGFYVSGLEVIIKLCTMRKLRHCGENGASQTCFLIHGVLVTVLIMMFK